MPDNNKFYVTSPIYYVNDKPHIGHAYTSLACDVQARFQRLNGKSVKFLTGTDEHGQKVAKSAALKNIDPQSFTDTVSQHFRDLITEMNFSPDDFIRTTETRHKQAAQYFWKTLEENGYIYKGKYEGWYAVRDEAYYAEDELIDGKAPTGAEVEWTVEESYFFKLSAMQDKLLELYKNNPDFIAPKSRYNEVISFVRGGKEYKKGALKDLSISRTSFSWGVPVPNDPEHVMYVWLDALTNYISALGYPDEKYKEFWPANTHIVGKDILRFHAVYWPAFLMAANLPLPQQIFAHGWWTNEGEKISKSLGNVIDPLALKEEFGLDQIRFFLLKRVVFGNDGDFSKEELIRMINSDLANNIGNLVQRTLSMVQKNCAGQVPKPGELSVEDQTLLENSYALFSTLEEHIANLTFTNYLEDIVDLAGKANEYIDKQAPWALKKEDPARMETVLYCLLERIRIIALYLLPVIPDSAGKILDFLACPADKRNFSAISAQDKMQTATKLPKPEAIFPRFV